MLVYVNTNDESRLKNSKKIIAESIAEVYGIRPAESIFDNWVTNYDEFFYDTDNNKLLFYKSRTAGYWKPDGDVLEAYKSSI
jgi:hypothetical protein